MFLNKKFKIVIERGENGFFIASVPKLRGCYTQAKTKPKLMANIKEAIELYLEVMYEDMMRARREFNIRIVEAKTDEAQALINEKVH